MTRATGRAAGLALAAAIAGGLLTAGSVGAEGYCGADTSTAAACPVGPDESVGGAIAPATASSADYFVFSARADTSMGITLDDAEAPGCSAAGSTQTCGGVRVQVYDSHGTLDATSGLSTPRDGVSVSTHTHVTLRDPGTYFAEVEGYANSQTVPYALLLDATPPVRWPAPCVVPRLPHRTRLRTARQRLVAALCAVGKVRYRHNVGVPRGDVIALRPRAGSVLAAHHRIAIDVSGR